MSTPIIRFPAAVAAALAFVVLTQTASLSAQSSANESSSTNLPAQRIGVNDLVAVSVYDGPEFTRTVRIGSEGSIRLPMVKQPIKAQGLMPADLETAIAEALQAEGILVDPVVTVTISEYESYSISIAGAVRAPATFQATKPMTLLEAIARAGGLTPEAGPQILVTRTRPDAGSNSVIATERVLVKSLIDAADPAANLVLSGGEEIRIPEAERVFVVGNVKKPGAFTLQDNAESTVLKALAMSEGLVPYAAKKAYIYRTGANGQKSEIPIELKQIMDRKTPDVTLVAKDILYVPDNSGKRAILGVLEKAIGFGTATASGLIVWSGRQ